MNHWALQNVSIESKSPDETWRMRRMNPNLCILLMSTDRFRAVFYYSSLLVILWNSVFSLLPSRHAASRQRRINVDATSQRCIDVDTTLYKRHVPHLYFFRCLQSVWPSWLTGTYCTFVYCCRLGEAVMNGMSNRSGRSGTMIWIIENRLWRPHQRTVNQRMNQSSIYESINQLSIDRTSDQSINQSARRF